MGSPESLGELYGAIFMLALSIGLYILPGAVASGRDHHHQAPIWVLNILLGWTVIGWVLALVWAAMPVKRRHTST
ncbi:superinfection immunity protein [Aquisalimonas asiatica]|uniref:Superinfection immunity protein n=1 Tax=Aquisalimonas asiatica TaxID=406100 RepID=A0A1H8UDK4_9GAMM|nr:superinfection immunity protein [Aquisalimonas asiatica]SEP00934.1 Superinfection immunity protein [Aquisalimonas asiatica]